jgi:uncharacterized repeat protein (TIGR03803 family)
MSANRLGDVGMLLAVLLFSVQSARAERAKLVYGFKHGSDGEYPVSEIITDASGDIFGTTSLGGAYNFGAVFELLPSGQEKLLHVFTDGDDDGEPLSGLISDAQGNLYGTTVFGGAGGNGTLFKIAPDGTETVLHAFAGGNDGAAPFDRPLLDSKGNLFGTTTQGGGEHCGMYGCGSVFEVTPQGKEKILYSFLGRDEGSGDGETPAASLIQDKTGNLYGTTERGGSAGWGTVFRVSPRGHEAVLHAFSPSSDGGLPVGGLVADKAGNLYGVTACCGANDGGTVFKVTPDGVFTVLHAFAGGTDGMAPYGLTIDDKGNLYGTTVEGGGTGCPNEGCGTVFKITPDGAETVVYAFGDGKKGASPSRSPLLHRGYIYATAQYGGAQDLGTVIKVKK